MAPRRALRALLGASLVVAAAAAQPPAAPARAVAKLTEPQDDYPDVSPDGRRIAFQSNRSGTWQLWIMNRDGSGLRRLTHSAANDRTPDWSPDGTRLLFTSDRADAAGRGVAPDRRNVFVVDVGPGLDDAEGRIARLVDHAGTDLHPRWALGGRVVVFNRVATAGERTVADVMLADADGRNVRRVPLPPGMNTYAELTPDGARLVFRGTTLESRDGRVVENSDVFTAAPDGSDRRRLTDDAAFDGWPALSPDGGTIAFASRRAGERFQLFLMPLAGGAPRQVTFGEFHHTQPAWAPDGRHLAAYRWAADRTAEVGHLVWLDLDAPWDEGTARDFTRR